MRVGRFAVGSVAALSLLLAGCQSVNEAAVDASPFTAEREEDPVVPIGPGGEITVEAGEFYFELLGGTAVDGSLTVNLENVGGAVHNFRIDEAIGADKKVEAAPGETATGELLLFGGTEYVYYCDVPGHRAAGMEGRLTVYLSEEEAVPVDEAEVG